MRDQGCLPYIIYFFVASSVLGALGTLMTAFFGLPYTWSALLYVPLLLGGLVLIYRGYSWMMWALVACIGFILLSVLAIGRGFLVTEPDIPEQLRGYLEASQSDSLFGINELYLNYGGSDEIGGDENKTIISYPYYEDSPRLQLTIYFPDLPSDGGQWAFVEGDVQTRGALNGTFEADPTDNWMSAEEAEFDNDLPPLPAQPYVLVTMPLSSNQAGKQLFLTVNLSVTYPVGGEVKTETLSRQIDTLVASDRYYIYADQYNQWQQARRVVESPLWIAMLIGSIAAGVGVVYLYRQGALQVMSTGSLIIQIQRQSGFKRLGVEAHNLAKVDVDVDAEKGVILGVVNAQSPAGRGGLRSGDILVSLNGKTIKTPRDVNSIGGRIKKGEKIPAQVIRNGETVDLEIKF